MILFAILLSSGLDMSLPEFEPTTDISGNYVYSDYDISENDVVVESEVLPQGLTTGALRSSDTDNNSDEDIISSIEHFETTVSNYWELFLDPYDVPTDYNETSFNVSSPSWTLGLDGSTVVINRYPIQSSVLCYYPVTSGIQYHISHVLQGYNAWCGVVDDISNPSVLTNTFYLSPTSATSYDITPVQDGYFVLTRNYTTSDYFDISWHVVETDSYTLTEMCDAIVHMSEEMSSFKDEVYMEFRVIRFILLFTFILPVAMKIRDHIFNLKHE